MSQPSYRITIHGTHLTIETGDEAHCPPPSAVEFDTDAFLCALFRALEPDLTATPTGEVSLVLDALPERCEARPFIPNAIGAKSVDRLVAEMSSLLEGEADEMDRAALGQCLERLESAKRAIKKVLSTH